MAHDLAIVLAAGKGTRMRSSRPKVVHKIAGRSMLGHVLTAVNSAQSVDRDLRCAVVVSAGEVGTAVGAEARRFLETAETFVQAEQRGTGDAVLAARDALRANPETVFVLFGDTPLITGQILTEMRSALDDGADVAVLAFDAENPTGYGRVVTDESGAVTGIVEEKDATPDQRAIHLCNSGVMAFRIGELAALFDRITANNVQGEYYLTDAIALARAVGLDVQVVTCDERAVLGVNDRQQLAVAERLYQDRARRRAMVEGATLIAPETVWFSADTQLGTDVLVEPNVIFGPGVQVADTATIRANSYLEGASVGPGCIIGPFARLRPGADLGADVRIGNFVEVKNVTMADGSKANHLSYLGDGTVGRGANVGAGTIFCNYDGFNKHRTEVGDGAFIGSNSALVAPVRIGTGAFVGSGSVISKDVADDALAIARAPQEVREDWARRFRERGERLKKAAKAKG
ncbi:MAG: bifunctional UDP-N-acetylglucosamine diphosphorylase/glucosamine-1-phosphate N-acetyltransferase GlmU [Pseudomonadota bacterium]